VKNQTEKQTPPEAKPKSPDERAAYTAHEAAWKLAVSVKTIYRWIDRGLLPTSKATRKLLIPASAVEKFMEVTQ
jgi:excisionase family DNA binding protein